MQPILILRHHPAEGPGYLGDWLEQNGLEWRLIAVDQGEPVPENPREASALVFLGGPNSVNETLPWIDAETTLIRRSLDAGIPMLGHCLGAQLIARALGAQVRRNKVAEIGWMPVEQTNHAATRDWLDGLPRRFDVFHWHHDFFALPDGAEPLLRSNHCKQQGFVFDNILALQCHLEMTPQMVREWSEVYAAELARGGPAVQDAEALCSDLEARCAALNKVAAQIYRRWAESI